MEWMVANDERDYIFAHELIWIQDITSSLLVIRKLKQMMQFICMEKKHIWDYPFGLEEFLDESCSTKVFGVANYWSNLILVKWRMLDVGLWALTS